MSAPAILESNASPRQKLAAYRPDLAKHLRMSKQPSYRASQIYEHLTVYPERPFKHATSLPASLRTELAEMGETLLSLQNHRDDAEGTTKLLLAARDGSLLEAVVMRYADRATVCVSTQVGCPLGCAFCSTGAMGFQRNLTPGEILDQVRVAQVLLRQESEDRRVTNVVYMGMGEPFLNLEALLTSVRLLIDGDGLNFARRAVSVSTVGIPEGIRALADHEPQVGLALSLHAPEDGLRNRLVPINKRFPISQIMTSVREHTARTHRKLMVEYVLLANVNDSLHHADSLAQLLRGVMVVVNLLPCNPGVGGFRPTSAAAAHSFKERLEKAGVRTTMRTTRGRSITAGCGQLATSSGNQLTTSSAKIRKNG